MTQPLSHRHHGKRSPGLTNTIRHTLLKAQKEQPQNQIINDLMAKLNSPSTQYSKRTHSKAYQANLLMHTSKNSQQFTIQAFQGASRRVAVGHLPQKQVHLSAAKLQRVLSADKAAFKMNGSRKFKHSKKTKAGLLGNPPQHLSKKSTEYSSQSEEQALKLENERFKELCASEQQNLARLEKLIANENKVQLLQRQMYEQNIQRLKKIAALQIFPSEGSDNLPDSFSESCEDCDCLSIESN